MNAVRAKRIGQRIRERLSLDMIDDAVIQGDGYEALIARNGVVVGRVYVGSLDEVESL